MTTGTPSLGLRSPIVERNYDPQIPPTPSHWPKQSCGTKSDGGYHTITVVPFDTSRQIFWRREKQRQTFRVLGLFC